MQQANQQAKNKEQGQSYKTKQTQENLKKGAKEKASQGKSNNKHNKCKHNGIQTKSQRCTEKQQKSKDKTKKIYFSLIFLIQSGCRHKDTQIRYKGIKRTRKIKKRKTNENLRS